MSVGHFDLTIPRGGGFVGFASGNPRTNSDTLFGNASSTEFVQKRLIPGLPDYSKIEVRMGSFIEKQQYFQQSVIDMAVAGFYYVGEPTPDAVKCPWCNSVGVHWEEDELPFFEHYKFSKSCAFVQNKIEKVIKNGLKSTNLYQVGVSLGYDETLVESIKDNDSQVLSTKRQHTSFDFSL